MRTNLTLLLLLTCITGAYAQPDERIAKSPKINYDWRPGFVSITEVSGAFGLMSQSAVYSKYYYGISTAAGYQFTRNIKAAIGAGIHIHNDGNLFPVFLDARYSFNANELVPFIAATGGVAVNFNAPDQETLNNQFIFLNPGIGLKWVAANRTAVSFSTGLFVMSATSNRHSFINFKLGIELKGR